MKIAKYVRIHPAHQGEAWDVIAVFRGSGFRKVATEPTLDRAYQAALVVPVVDANRPVSIYRRPLAVVFADAFAPALETLLRGGPS